MLDIIDLSPKAFTKWLALFWGLGQCGRLARLHNPIKFIKHLPQALEHRAIAWGWGLGMGLSLLAQDFLPRKNPRARVRVGLQNRNINCKIESIPGSEANNA